MKSANVSVPGRFPRKFAQAQLAERAAIERLRRKRATRDAHPRSASGFEAGHRQGPEALEACLALPVPLIASLPRRLLRGGHRHVRFGSAQESADSSVLLPWPSPIMWKARPRQLGRFAGNRHLALRVASWTNLGASVRTAYSSPNASSPNASSPNAGSP